jgi:HSP20 family protein
MTTTSSEESKREREKEAITPLSLRNFDRIYENFRRDLERTFKPWSMSSWDWEFPSIFGEERESRLALCDLVDRGDKYELQVEVPGIEKERIDVKATHHSVEISGKQSEKTEEKSKNYVYNERSFRSFYRRVPIPEEIVPSKVSAKMNNGILNVELPKKTPTKVEDESTNVKVQ